LGAKSSHILCQRISNASDDAEIQIELGTIQNILGGDKLLSNDQVIMTIKSAKILSIILSKAVQGLEERFGEIKLDETQLAPLVQAVKTGETA
jgi:hypothetical protein